LFVVIGKLARDSLPLHVRERLVFGNIDIISKGNKKSGRAQVAENPGFACGKLNLQDIEVMEEMTSPG
jgi:hypothetical protein